MYPGDAIMLKVAAAGFAHVSVLTRGVAGAALELFRGTFSSAEPVELPTSWQLDSADGPERLAVVLSQRALTLSESDALARAGVRDEHAWTLSLLLPKRAPPPGPSEGKAP
jgi:hypothetical protein